MCSRAVMSLNLFIGNHRDALLPNAVGFSFVLREMLCGVARYVARYVAQALRGPSKPNSMKNNRFSLFFLPDVARGVARFVFARFFYIKYCNYIN